MIHREIPGAHAPSRSVSDFLLYLRRQVLGNYVVHQETLPPRPARRVEDLSDFPPVVPRILEAAGIPALYTHQAEGIGKVLAGQNVAVATPTASGKTLVYNVPVVARLLEDPGRRALYIFPLKALEQDQLDELRGCWTGWAVV